MQFALPSAMPDIPAQAGTTWGAYDLVTGSMFVTLVLNEKKAQYKVMPRYSDAVFTPDAMSGEGVR
jgi:hypothetical protein